MRVAITTDWMDTFGGGERVLLELHRMFPEAPVYTTVYDPKAVPASMRGWDVRTSFIQRIPFVRGSHIRFLALMPLAFEQFDMGEYDLVVTTNSACAKGVITRPGTLNLCYCHTPCRYIWDLFHEYTDGRRGRALMGVAAHWLRMWDRMSADRVDHFVANSREVAGRIRRHYRRESEVIHPPVDVDRIRPSGRDPEDFYLVVSRLVSYKRVDLAVRAANLLGRRLVVVGDGPARRELEAMAGPTVTFRGRLPDEEVAELYARSRGFLFPGLEDFGIAPVEAQAAGRPVIAFGKGGALETVMDGTTGAFFDEQTPEAVAEAILQAERLRFDPADCRRNAERFDAREFRRRMRVAIDRELRVAQRSAAGPRLDGERASG
ncbi:MAG TPA: glycosyltransferase [Longimicrobiaceae bacterium]|jgi:glycosyltransferase involved in cell wall biosynthesis|nr:glycosyltransferase [Longimicrobiaceae bacterium]